MKLTLAFESPTAADGVALVRQLDAHLAAIYDPEHSHRLPVEALAQPNTRFCIARVEGVAVGCGALRTMEGYAEVKRMYVQPHMRGKGIAQAILRRLEEEAAAQAQGVVRLETGAFSPEAIALYARSGYVRIPAYGEYVDNGVNLCYEKLLP